MTAATDKRVLALGPFVRRRRPAKLTIVTATALIATTLALGVAKAGASTVSLDTPINASATLVYEAADGETNRLEVEPIETPGFESSRWPCVPVFFNYWCLIWPEPVGVTRQVRVYDPGATITVEVGSPCTSVSKNEAICSAIGSGYISSARIALGDGHDSYAARGSGRFRGQSEVQGEAGNDKLTGSSSQWSALDGGPGADEIAGEGYADYRARITPVTVSDDGVANDGEAEGDNVSTDVVVGGSAADTLSGFATMSGSGGNDTLRADEAGNRLLGDSGNDKLVGGNGDDWFVGGDGDDELAGGAGADTLGVLDLYWDSDGGAGPVGAGSDVLDGGAGPDALYGGHGDDVLDGGAGSDALYGDGLWVTTGNDELRSRDGERDYDRCGGGSDRVLSDPVDDVGSDCELINPVDTTPPETTISSGPSGPTNDATPTFGFSSSESGSSFECKVDAGAYASCSSPHTTAALSQGQHTFYVRAKDAAGNLDPTPASRAFRVDTTPPTAKAPVEALTKDSALATATLPATFPVTESWSGSDGVSSASELRYDLARSVNSSGTWDAFANVLTATSVTSLAQPLTQDYGYQYRARARDAAGNYSAWATGQRLSVRVQQETPSTTSPSLSYSTGWTSLSQSDASGGAVRSSSTVGAKATLTFTGRAVAVVMPKASTLGNAKLCLDPGTATQSCETLDLSPASGLGTRKLVFVRNALSTSSHVLQVTVASGRIDLDGFALLVAAS